MSSSSYHVRIEAAERSMSELVPGEDNDYTEVFRQPLESECVQFSLGNPRVEHITGLVHLYKRNTTPYGSQEAWKQQPPASGSPGDVSNTLCCLAVPADMSVSHFCTFIGAYLAEVQALQVLRREGARPSVCMVLLTFGSQDTADSFYSDYNGMPFSSLEPDIVCRLVYVRTVEVLSSRGRSPSLSLPAAAGSEHAAAPAAAAAAGATSSKHGGASSSRAGSATNLQHAAAAAGECATGAKAAVPSPSAAAAKDTASPGAVSAADSSKAASRQAEGAPAPAGPDQPGSSRSSSASPAPEPAGPSYAAAVAGPAAAAAAQQQAQQQQHPAAAPWLQPPPGTTELPTCPVCLERLDEHISGIVTTVCNHRFHGECLKHWGDTSCPVCRYCMLSSPASTSACSTCGSHANLWICLICGHVGCGRYKQGHANDHWKQSAHCYALELETQRVWDYAGDGYVHRLIQSKTDGKLVEVPSPAPTCPHGSPATHRHHHARSRAGAAPASRQPGGAGAGSGSSAAAAGASGSAGAGGDGDGGSGSGSSSGGGGCPACEDEQQQMKEVLVGSKLEAVTLEYNYLLTTQLDSQRQYFEGLLAAQDAKQAAALAAARAAAEAAEAAHAAAEAAARESERKRQQLERKLAELSGRASKAAEEREFLRSLNETLLCNQKDFGAQLGAAQAALAAKEAAVDDLQEQVRDLMVYIEAQRTIQSAGGSELQAATLLPVPAKPGNASGSGSRRRSSKK